MKKSVFALLILLLVSCQSNKKEDKKELIVAKPVSEVEIEEENDSLIYKIEENTIVIAGDTLKIEAPFLYSFEGILEADKKIQIHISNKLTEEYGGYWKSGRLYIDGEKQVFGFGIIKDKKDNFYTGKVYYDANESEKTICNLKLYNLGTEKMFIECFYNKKSYKIFPSKKFPSYKCFDKIDYTLFDTREAYKKGTARDYTPSRDYIFIGEMISNDKSFDVLSSNLKYLFSDSLSIKDHRGWKHNFDIKKAQKEEDNYMSESLFTSSPIFIDSDIYVFSSYFYSYMGGAHGMYHTSYDNYEISTGKKIEITQILKTKDEDFIEFYDNRVRTECGDTAPLGIISLANNFYILPTGITFSYAPYELLGFAGGEPDFFFSYEELEPYILKNTILNKYYSN
ncbi:RsiV family protein [Flavobacterium ustbae]|uniref:RsiV family protein n=1 Tax=Flavobacterium ustbae TaxID=2488790 RepID=UPI000F77486D|nr:RsiV family protein [Flavobacterium ustbae]